MGSAARQTRRTGHRLAAIAFASLAAAPTAALPAGDPAPPQALGCLIESERSADVGASVVGTIESVRVDRGDPVRKGQVLATLTADVERANVDTARNRANNDGEIQAAKAMRDNADERLRSMSRLFELGGAGALERDQARSELESAEGRYQQALQNKRTAQAELSVALAQLAQRTVVAPFDAVVVERHVQPGERVDGRPMFRVATAAPLKVEIVVPTASYGQFRVGMPVDVTPEYPSARPIVASVARIDRQVDAASATFRARLTLPNPDGSIPAGLRCKVDWRPPPPR
ncbi:MAG: efflux RND transporter periplasmic adaptor subunit [Burkholderiaceae bacterium]